MTNENHMDALESAYQRGVKGQTSSLTERLASLDQLSGNSLANFAILGLPLSFPAMKYFFNISGIILSDDEHIAWLVPCLEMNLLKKLNDSENGVVTWQPHVEVFSYFSKHSKPEDLYIYHLNADKFILEQFVDIAKTIGIQLPDDDNLREAINGPFKFLFQISNQPQHQKFHQIIINLSVNWFGHLFQLENYIEAADILNSIFHALARNGQPELAKNMLAAIMDKSTGIHRMVAQINLATLLREEKKLSLSLRLYRHSIPKLLVLHAHIQLAQVLSEMATVYNELGKSMLSALILELSIFLHKRMKNKKSIAIAKDQLATTYRSLQMYSCASRNSKGAIMHFRKAHDLLNLGRSLITQGNIRLYQKKTDSAIICFDEAYEISEKIADTITIINALSGKALVLLELKQYDESQTLLEQVIQMRELNNDHNIGVEYHNMGFLNEQKGEFSTALGWYRKALIQFEKYIPVDVPNCRRCISRAESKYKRQRSHSNK